MVMSSCFLTGSVAGQQTQIDITQLKNLDLTRKGTILFRTGGNMPATCSPGEALLNTSAPPGLNLYVCLSPDTWVLQTDNHSFALIAAPGAVPLADGAGKLSQSWIDYSGYQSALGFTPLNRASNLSDIASLSAARANLGLGSAAVKEVQGAGALLSFAGGITIAGDCVVFDATGNLADSGDRAQAEQQEPQIIRRVSPDKLVCS